MIVIVFAKKGITMKNIFQKSSSNWVKYEKYEWRTATNGKCYITPSADAKPSIYNPIKDYEKLVLTAINIGTNAMNRALINLQSLIFLGTFRRFCNDGCNVHNRN